MAESKEKQLHFDSTAEIPAVGGKDLLTRLGQTVKNKAISQSGFIDTAASFTAGDIIADKYQIIQLLSRGNMGLVYQARHLLLDKVFAIKVLAPEKPLEEAARQRFEREARATASLNHPNIISVHDFGLLENGALYLVMEYLEGETLAARLEREHQLDLDSALPIFKQVCQALAYAHKEGVVHRDLKPSNIMLIKDYNNEDQALVIDFSIARFTRKKPNQKTITKPGQIFGSPLYMSPEQCQGKRPDHRSDIYSLGCVMYEILCGAPPLTGDTMLATIYKHVNELPVPFSEHIKNPLPPKTMQAIVFKALAKQPENRFQTAAELGQALEHLPRERGHEIRNNTHGAPSLQWMGKFFTSIIISVLFIVFAWMLATSGVRH